jgi:cytochrome c oxidase subunit 2
MISFFHSASEFSPKVDHLALSLFVACGFFVVLVWALIIYFCVRYRANAKVDRTNPPLRNRKVELSLIAIMLIFGLTVFGFSTKLYYEMYTPPTNAREIFGVAKQWMWVFHDPNGRDQINELTVPLNTPVKLTLISEDVIHSLYIPAFRVKQDVLPSRYTSLWFTATKLGDFPLFCTQYCGLSHANMVATVHVVKPEKMGLALLGSRPRGEKLFQEKGCASCHANFDDTTGIGPSLKGLYQSKVTLQDGSTVIADEAYLRESILSPNAKIVKGYRPVMPTYHGVLSEDEIREIIGYLKSGQGNSL